MLKFILEHCEGVFWRHHLPTQTVNGLLEFLGHLSRSGWVDTFVLVVDCERASVLRELVGFNHIHSYGRAM